MRPLRRFRAIFRAMDEDKNGWVDREELRTLPERTNMAHFIKPEVMEEFIEMMDIDKDGRILYKEFVGVIMADDLFNIEAV